MSLNRYYGTLMYCTFLPFSIYALDEKEALEISWDIFYKDAERRGVSRFPDTMPTGIKESK